MIDNIVYDYRGDPSSIVEIDTTWFLWFNTVLLAFAMTFIVHFNCLYNAVLLLKRHPKNKLFWMSVIQNMCAVACHISRVTDYFFLTDCHVKPFHNYIQYWISNCIMDLIVLYRDVHRLEVLFQVPKLVKYSLWVILGILPTLAKSTTMFLTTLSLNGTMGQFAICDLVLNNAYFDLAHWSWIIYHSLMFCLHGLILLTVYKNIAPLPRRPISADELTEGDYGTIVLSISDVTAVTFYLLLIYGNFTPGAPDVILQLLWATKSKCTVEMLETYSLYLEDTADSPQFGKSSKFFMATGDDMDLEGQTAYRSQNSTEDGGNVSFTNPRNRFMIEEESRESFGSVTPQQSHQSTRRILS